MQKAGKHINEDIFNSIENAEGSHDVVETPYGGDFNDYYIMFTSGNNMLLTELNE